MLSKSGYLAIITFPKTATSVQNKNLGQHPMRKTSLNYFLLEFTLAIPIAMLPVLDESFFYAHLLKQLSISI